MQYTRSIDLEHREVLTDGFPTLVLLAGKMLCFPDLRVRVGHVVAANVAHLIYIYIYIYIYNYYHRTQKKKYKYL